MLWVDGYESSRVNERLRCLLFKHGTLEHKFAAVDRELSGQHHFIAIRHHALDVRLVEPDHVGKVAVFVRKLGVDDLLPRSGPHEFEMCEYAADRYFFPYRSRLNRRNRTQVFVCAGEIQKQITDRLDAHALKRIDEFLRCPQE